mgnify:CR=1 FL=1
MPPGSQQGSTRNHFPIKGQTLYKEIRKRPHGLRAALIADDLAKHVAFFSFGTNDLTQMTLGLSRDDAGAFMPNYLEKGIFKEDPFVTLDQQGVGELMRIAAERGRKGLPGIKLGICGEHGGDAASVEFCHRLGFNYVSCSPFRVPVARLAAAQATLRN